MKNSTFLKLRQFALGTMVCLVAFTSCRDEDNGGDTSTFQLDRNNLKGEITDGVVTLNSGTYKLTGALIVRDGATLTIEQGVTIEATDVTSQQPDIRYIAVAQGGKINVKGTSTAPVVMTAATKTPGAWGGVVLCGRAPINKGATAQAEVSDLTYGGTDVNDNSGSLKYLRIEYSGYAYNSEKEFNGLSMFGVGKGTTIEYIQSYEGSDDAFEWFGGTVDARYLVAINKSAEVADDMFDWTEGWNGTGENWYGWKTNDGNRGIEADNNSNNHAASPVSNPTIRNLTLIGNNGGPENQAIKMRVGTNGNFDNVVLKGWGTGFDIQHDESIAFVVAGSLKATKVRFIDVAAETKGTSTANAAVDVSALISEDVNATGAGNGVDKPIWADGWTIGW